MLNMCYGLVMEAEDVAKELGLVQVDLKCGVCDYEVEIADNFCRHCGTKIRNKMLTPGIQRTLEGFNLAFGTPPKPLLVMHTEEIIAVGQILSVDDTVPVLSFPVQCNTELIKKAIETYLKRRKMPSIPRDMKLFSIGGTYNVQAHNNRPRAQPAAVQPQLGRSW